MKNKNLNVYIVSTCLPNKCGIATFTDNLKNTINNIFPNFEIKIIALEDQNYRYNKDVVYKIDVNDDKSYLDTANFINLSDADVVVIEHEFNIFGSANGSKILYLLEHLKKPVIVTLHTVPVYQKKPFLIIPKKYKSRLTLLKNLLSCVDGITVMTKYAKSWLLNNFILNEKRIAVIPHGAPNVSMGLINQNKKNRTKLGINKNDFVLTSFGRIRPKKGLEYVIKAMPKIILDHKDKEVKYFILGKPHPDYPIEYFNGLRKLVRDLHLEKNVIINSQYLSEKEIYQYLSNTDIFITPYYTKEQTSSGVLSYAIAAGCCIVSTPYLYAYDLIKTNKVGELIEFKDSKSIEKVVNKLINHPNMIEKYQKNSFKLGRSLHWSKIAKEYVSFIKRIIKQ